MKHLQTYSIVFLGLLIVIITAIASVTFNSRRVIVNSENAVKRTFPSPYLYRAIIYVEKYYDIGVGMAIGVRMDDSVSVTFAEYVVFEDGEMTTMLDKWENNCHSDAIYSNVEPDKTFPISYEIKSVELEDNYKTYDGMMDQYRVYLHIDGVSDFMLKTPERNLSIPLYIPKEKG